jgi:hypothetical protein
MRKTKSNELHKFREVFLALCKSSKIIKDRDKIEKQKFQEVGRLKREDELRKTREEENKRREKDMKETFIREQQRQERLKQTKDVDKKKMILLLQQQLEILENEYSRIKRTGKYNKSELDRIDLKITLLRRKLKNIS